MTSSPDDLSGDLRARLLAAPEIVLEDADLMRALIAAGDARRGDKVVDLRGRWMAQLEDRLRLLETTHKDVLAAAYDNVAGTRQIHRAVLALLEPADPAALLEMLPGRLCDILHIDAVELWIEGDLPPGWSGQGAWLRALAPGGVAARLSDLRAAPDAVTLRRCGPGDGAQILSQALLPLDLGGRPALIVLGAAEVTTFAPPQGTDLLAFLQGVLARVLARAL